MTFSAWLLLGIAILLADVATSFLELSNSFEKSLLGVASAIWARCGMALVAVIGALFFGQRLEAAYCIFIAMIVVGAVGLRLTTAA